jgi:hypothetical protein
MARLRPASGDGRAASAARGGTRRVGRRPSQGKVALTIRFEPIVLDELRRRAEHAHLSLSMVVTLLLAEALRAGVEHEHGALIEQVISRTLEQRLWRVEALVRRVAVDAAQAKKLAYAAFAQGVDLELARSVRDRARRDAWADLHAALPEQFPLDEPVS